jgi:hypothetical protein
LKNNRDEKRQSSGGESLDIVGSLFNQNIFTEVDDDNQEDPESDYGTKKPNTRKSRQHHYIY